MSELRFKDEGGADCSILMPDTVKERKLKELIEKQIDDESLWHWPKSDLEKALHDALLEVHGVVGSGRK